MENVYLAGAVRTPIGRYGGALAGLTPAELGARVAAESLKRAGFGPGEVQEVVWGCARQAGAGPNVGRQIAYRAGVPETVPAYTVNQACGSGLKAIILAAQEITLGRARAVLAGGVESMSRVPYLAEGARWGLRMGDAELVDGMYRDGFLDPLSGLVMGQTAERLARDYAISREEQDAYALRTQQRAAAAIKSGRFDEEIVPVELKGRKGEPTSLARDEHPRADTSIEALGRLAPVFSKEGTVTAGNSSGITDGAAAVVVCGEEALKNAGGAFEPLARVVDYEFAGVAPEVMGLGPVPAVRRLLERRKLTPEDLDLVELNEAFAAQVIACDRELHFDPSRLNVNGGAIALGHPIGCTGVRITTTLLYELKKRGARLGLATLCVSGGMGIALLVERV
ncbi:MAG: acetyl-CoA C-acetyltransferase [Acidobacteriota bacterium]|nr:acetyl-CoA C-acetyltransferase [Acidobacteriota bacterium]MDQ5839016.1 acetyl-CoA C-acetyltransferase [Acidobacteriota bacterium]